MIPTNDAKVSATIYKGFHCYQLITGEIGMDKEGLAKACGIDKTMINYLIKKRSSVRFSQWFSDFADRDVELARKCLHSKGKPRIIFRWDFCVAVMAYCAAPKPERKGKPDTRDRSGRKRKQAPKNVSESLITSYYFPK